MIDYDVWMRFSYEIECFLVDFLKRHDLKSAMPLHDIADIVLELALGVTLDEVLGVEL